MDPVSSIRCKELLILLRKITQAVDLHSKYLNKNFGLTGPQLIILQELSNGDMTVSELARKVSLSQGTVTDIIHRLEKKDLIIKRRSNQDKRRVLITLSEKCKVLLALAPPPLNLLPLSAPSFLLPFMSSFSHFWKYIGPSSSHDSTVEMYFLVAFRSFFYFDLCDHIMISL